MDCFSVFAKTRPLPAFAVMVWHIFDADIPHSAIEALYDDLRERKFQDPRSYDPTTDRIVNPPIFVESDPRLVPGVRARRRVRSRPLGAYSQGKIHVSAELVQMARAEPRCGFFLQIVLLEEFGHHLDYLLRNRYSTIGGDARFDEGAVFALHMHPVRDGELERYPFAYDDDGVGFELVTADPETVNEVIPPERIQADETDSTDEGNSVEYFDAHASPVLSHSHQGNASSEVRGHREIEMQLMVGPAISFWRSRFLWVYFGNWLRDISQISDILLAPGYWVDEARGRHRGYFACINQALRVNGGSPTVHINSLTQCFRSVRQSSTQNAGSGTDSPGVAAFEEIYLNFVNLYAEWDLIRLANQLGERTSPWPFFATNDQNAPYRLGKYDALEHMDNPGRDRIETVNSSHDSDRYLQPSHLGDSVDYVNRQLELAMSSTRPVLDSGSSREISHFNVQRMYFGNALHAIEDYFAHSNFVELCLAGYLESGSPNDNVDTKVPYVELDGSSPGRLTRVRPSSPRAHRPLMTGSFGGLDTAVSLLAMVAEALGDSRQDDDNSADSAKNRLLLIIARRISPGAAILIDNYYLRNRDLRRLVGVFRWIYGLYGSIPEDDGFSVVERGMPELPGFRFLASLREPYRELLDSVSERIEDLAIWIYKELVWSLTQFIGGEIIKALTAPSASGAAASPRPHGLRRMTANQRDQALALLGQRDISGFIDLLGAAFGMHPAVIAAAHTVCVIGSVKIDYEIRNAAARSVAVLAATIPSPQAEAVNNLVESIGLRTRARNAVQSIPPAEAFHAAELLVGLYQDIANEDIQNPTHTQLSKDHGTNPLHVLAADLALWADHKMMVAMEEGWQASRDGPTSERSQRAKRLLQETASKILRHPIQYYRDAGRPGIAREWKGELETIISLWRGRHPAAAAIAGSPEPAVGARNPTSSSSPASRPSQTNGGPSPSGNSVVETDTRVSQFLYLAAGLGTMNSVFLSPPRRASHSQ